MCPGGSGHPGHDIVLPSINPTHNKSEVNKYPSVIGKGQPSQSV